MKRRRNLLHVVSTEVMDEYTLLIKLDAPFAPILNRIASISIISPAALEKHGNKGIIINPVGTGPYVYEKWTPGDKMVVRTNENYWKEGPKIDNLLNTFNFGFIGEFTERKNIQALARAFHSEFDYDEPVNLYVMLELLRQNFLVRICNIRIRLLT